LDPGRIIPIGLTLIRVTLGESPLRYEPTDEDRQNQHAQVQPLPKNFGCPSPIGGPRGRSGFRMEGNLYDRCF
jgi:hypothetical protein